MKNLNEGIYPSDIKKMSIREMEFLCTQVREKLIDSVSKTGGHLASNLGIVELTVAMHYVFNTPEDKIVWDVGHQSYVHKILTGRAAEFSKLRKLDGLSGFPKRSESEYDTFDTGHSSNSISAALGMAVARDFKGETNSVIAVIGDGALTGGMAYEALNNAGVLDSNLIVILNDNAMSISKDHGSLSRHLGKLRTSEKYAAFKHALKDRLMHIPKIGSAIADGLESMRDAVKYMMLPGVLFEELGFIYLGPVDGHNIQELIEVLQLTKAIKKPVFVHCLTQKGKGYRPAEKRPDLFHGITPFDPKTGNVISSKTGDTWSDIFGKKILSAAHVDKRIVAVSAAMVNGTGLAGFARECPDRVYDVGIAEEHAVTFAAGLAVSGMKPVVAIYSTFLQRAYDQILIDVCMQKLPVIFCIDRAGIVGADGETHHGIFDLSYLNHMPNLTIFTPSDRHELENMFDYALKQNEPYAIRYPRGSVVENISEAPDDALEWKPVPRILRYGYDITIAAEGKMTSICMMAAEKLENIYNISCTVIDARIIRPLTSAAIDIYMSSASKTKRLLAVEDNVIVGGYGSNIESIFASIDSIKVYKAGWPDMFIAQGSQAELEHRYLIDSEGIVDRVRKIIEGKA